MRKFKSEWSQARDLERHIPQTDPSESYQENDRKRKMQTHVTDILFWTRWCRYNLRQLSATRRFLDLISSVSRNISKFVCLNNFLPPIGRQHRGGRLCRCATIGSGVNEYLFTRYAYQLKLIPDCSLRLSSYALAPLVSSYPLSSSFPTSLGFGPLATHNVLRPTLPSSDVAFCPWLCSVGLGLVNAGFIAPRIAPHCPCLLFDKNFVCDQRVDNHFRAVCGIVLVSQ